MAAAIVQATKDRGLALSDAAEFQSQGGKGITGVVDGRQLVIGNQRNLTDAGIDTASLAGAADALGNDGATALFVGRDRQPLGIIGIADPVKPTTLEALNALRQAGIRVPMLTGDNRATAMAVAKSLGITEVEADVLPADKCKVVERLRREGRVVAMAGDGVNDAPALAAADVGIAMGTGTDVAMQSAGVTLVKGNFNGIARARDLSVASMSNIRQNLVFAFVYNAAGVPIAAGALFRFRHHPLTDDSRRRYVTVVSQRDRQRAAPAQRQDVSFGPLGAASSGAASARWPPADMPVRGSGSNYLPAFGRPCRRDFPFRNAALEIAAILRQLLQRKSKRKEALGHVTG